MTETKTIHPKIFFENALEISALSKDRKKKLSIISEKIAQEYAEHQKVNLNFICTHNSRRSQLAQVWSFFAISYFKLKNMYAFSGGTEATAFHKNTVKTLQSIGFKFNLAEFNHQNPIYEITFETTKKLVLGFSKTFDDVRNQKPYIAITTCNNADENCPFIPDAIHRFHLPFIDPKNADKTVDKDNVYLNTNRQIAAEIFIIFSKVKELTNN